MANILFSLFLLLPLLSTAQNWSPVRPDLSYMYEYPDTTIEYISVKENFGEYYGVKVDSSYVSNEENIYYPSYFLRNIQISMYGPMFTYAPGPKGKIFIENRDTSGFIQLNENGDSIYFPANYEDDLSWTFFETDSLIFTARVTELSSGMVIDSLDSVATIILSYEQKTDGPSDHPMDGAVLKISKNFGLFEHPDLYSFPENSMLGYITLAGIDSLGIGVQDISGKDLNLQVGQVQHLRGYSYGEYISYTERKITDISETDTNFRLIYDFREVNISLAYNFETEDFDTTDYVWSNGIDTLFVGKNEFNRLPGTIVDEPGYFYFICKLDSVEKIYSEDVTSVIYNADTIPPVEMIIDFPAENYHFNIWEGPTNRFNGPGPSSFIIYNTVPGEFEYGDPFNFDSLFTLTSVAGQRKDVQMLSIYPNPVEKGEQINLPESLETFEVRDMNGRLLSDGEEKNFILNKPGFYIITGEDADGILYQGKVLVR